MNEANVSSGLARFTLPGSAPYASMMGAVEVLTRYVAKELDARGIAVNTVAPGAIATDFSGGMIRDNPEVNKRVVEMTALGRVGQPDDIGPMIASLLSEDNRWVNGQRIEAARARSLGTRSHECLRRSLSVVATRKGRGGCAVGIERAAIVLRGSPGHSSESFHGGNEPKGLGGERLFAGRSGGGGGHHSGGHGGH